MKIIAATKTLNEERNIANFCRGYDWADVILVADGGSIDQTAKIASHFPNVHIRDFEHRIDMPGTPEGFMNPEPKHINFLVDWAVEEHADWIVLDGADCWPNPRLKREARQLFEETDRDAVHLHRLYIWGTDEYFPKYNGGGYALWAWRPDRLDIRCEENSDTCFDSQMVGIDLLRALILYPPFCLLHYFAPDEGAVQMKSRRYGAWGHPQVHPLDSIYAPPEPLPEWALK